MERKEGTNLEGLVGTTVQINPRALLNRGRLKTVQSWLDLTKLSNAMRGIPDLEVEPPKGWISEEKNGTVYTVGDGNHRIGLAIIANSQTPFLIMGVWKGGKRFGFNKILNKIRSQLK